MTNCVDKNLVSYQIAYESFGLMTMDMELKDRMNYRKYAMEAMTGPDAGMLMEKLYKSVSSRANVNFGKIPDSCGDLTAFVRYKQIHESLDILRTAFASTRIMEFDEAQSLHDNLIRLRDDFAYGFKMDSQFLKTTYNTMVYTLCEMINLATVIYIDQCKAAAEGKTFTYKPYKDLILVQNTQKFNKMVQSGEWAQMMLTLRKNPENLTGGGVLNEASGILRFLGIGTKIGGAGAVAKFVKDVKSDFKTEFIQTKADMLVNIAKKTPTTVPTDKVKIPTDGAVKRQIVANKLWNNRSVPGKILTVLVILVGILLLIRSLICLYWRCKYTIRDILDDNAKLLKASMEVSKDNTASSLEKQQKMYEFMVNTRDKMEKQILADDANGRKQEHEANKGEMTITPPTTQTEPADTGSFVFG